MKIQYLLSNRQKKELLVRGIPIQIALPAPPIEIDNCVDWARSVLPADLRPLVTAAEEAEVRVGVIRTAGGLTELFGPIHAEGEPIYTIPVVVVIARLSPAQPRGNALPPQWPADVLIDGKSLLAPPASRHRMAFSPRK